MPGMENVKFDRHFPSVLPIHFSSSYYDIYSLNVEFRYIYMENMYCTEYCRQWYYNTLL